MESTITDCVRLGFTSLHATFYIVQQLYLSARDPHRAKMMEYFVHYTLPFIFHPNLSTSHVTFIQIIENTHTHTHFLWGYLNFFSSMYSYISVHFFLHHSSSIWSAAGQWLRMIVKLSKQHRRSKSFSAFSKCSTKCIWPNKRRRWNATKSSSMVHLKFEWKSWWQRHSSFSD